MTVSHGQASTLASVVPLIAVLTLIWGTNWVLFPLAVEEVSVWTFRAICLGGAGLLLLGVAQMRGLSLAVPAPQRRPLVFAALVYLVTWNVGSTYASVLIPSGQAAVLGFSMPIWAALFSWLFDSARPSRRLLLSVVLTGTGIAILAIKARHSYASAPLGFALGIGAGMGWAAGTLMLKRAQITVPPIVSTGWQLVAGALPLTAVALCQGSREWFIPSWSSVLVIGYITLVPMALGNVTWFSIVHRVPANLSGLSTVAVPMLAMVTGSVARQEPLGWPELSAMLCCGLALALALFRPWRV
ncbi:DMT family transporter [Curvibacter sp. HBC28]|uniref:DMT family transporter n=1 Tax=Curvibacter microcysteis TaxID=3026419 RepID=A0ABT5MBC7_9BURK|nr:DMT family transporter [Curvibacter sp. HBC28]MDD0813212.1 DMT family transporter [Curvibacter sp. HBC28]